MQRLADAEELCLQRRICGLALSLTWVMGILSGVLLFLYAGDFMVSLMRGLLNCSVSIVGLLCIGFLPFLITAFAVCISELRLLFLICFWKAFLHAFASIGIFAAFSSAGWLVRGLMQFSGSVWCILLYFFWHRIAIGRKAYWSPVVITGLLAGGFDYYVISPFLAGLIEI